MIDGKQLFAKSPAPCAPKVDKRSVRVPAAPRRSRHFAVTKPCAIMCVTRLSTQSSPPVFLIVAKSLLGCCQAKSAVRIAPVSATRTPKKTQRRTDTGPVARASGARSGSSGKANLSVASVAQGS